MPPSLRNGFFQIDTVLDSIGPNRVTIGTETFTADQIAIRLFRSPTEADPNSNRIGLAFGVGEISVVISARTNDFSPFFGDMIDVSTITVPQTLGLAGDVRMVNEPINGAIEIATVASGSATLTFVVPEPNSLARLCLGGLLVGVAAELPETFEWSPHVYVWAGTVANNGRGRTRKRSFSIPSSKKTAPASSYFTSSGSPGIHVLSNQGSSGPYMRRIVFHPLPGTVWIQLFS